MRYAVLQAFKTPLRRYRPGMEVDDSELDGTLLATEWETLGVLGAGPVDEAVAAAAKEVLREEAEVIGLTIDPDVWGEDAMQDAIDAEVAEQAAVVVAEDAAELLAASAYTVLEDFVTPDRRFLAGMEISGADVSGPVPLDDWVGLGLLEEAA